MFSKRSQTGEPSQEFAKKDKQMDDITEGSLSTAYIKKILDGSTASLAAADNAEKNRVSFVETGSVASSTADEDKDRDELLSKVQELRLDLKQAKLDQSAEKTMNRKKDRSLVKLAKELNKRGDDIRNKKAEIAEMTSTVAKLEAQLAANKSELEQRVATNERQTREYNARITELQDEHRKVWEEHHSAITEMQNKHINASQEHVETTDRMRKEILALKRTIEKLREELSRVGDEKAADEIVSRNMTAPLTYADVPISKGYIWKTRDYVVGGLVALLAVTYQRDLLSANAFCAPAMPGTSLGEDMTSAAPWWAPASLKEKSFALCGDRPRTRIQVSAKGGSSRIQVSSLDSEVSKVFFDKQVDSAKVHSGHISTFDKKGVLMDVKAPWAL